MKILSIETSCDETSLALIDINEQSVTIHAHEILSQIDVHREYGGVFPSLAKREHGRNLVPLFEKTVQDCAIFNSQFSISKGLSDDKKKGVQTILGREPELCEQFLEKIAPMEKPEVDAIAVTHGPGLEPALWVGINFAKALNVLWGIPVIPVNHMEGHIASVLLGNSQFSIFNFQKKTLELQEVEFPSMALLVSGGHTELVLIKDWGRYEIVGQTVDDAVGEAFDKVARLLDLPYPGGPEISKLAQSARENGIPSPFSLPRPMLSSGDLNFSFSGIKTAVRYEIDKLGKLTDEQKQGAAREFENAVTETLITKTECACEKHEVSSFLLAGGVAANSHLIELIEKSDTLSQTRIAPQALTGDNALMIAIAGWLRSQYDPSLVLNDPSAIEAIGSLALTEPTRITK